MSLTPEIPTPKKLLKEAKAEPLQHPYDLSDYGHVIDTLFKKGFSYAKIAKWFSARLGGTVKRGQIYYTYQNWSEKKKGAETDAWLAKQEKGSVGDVLDGKPSFDPALEEMIRTDQERQLDAEAKKEDSKRRRKPRRKAP